MLARHKYGTSCRVPKSITDVLNKSDLLALNLPLSTPEGIVCALSEVGDLSGDGFVSDDWRQLVIMVQNPFEQPAVVAALRKIALYPAENGSLVNLEGCSFYEDKYLVAPQLRAFVNILQLDGDERLMGRMKRLAKRWNPNACIQAADRHLTGLCDFVPVVLDALSSTQIIMGLLNNGFELKVVEEADFLEEFDPRYNEEGVSELDEQFERLPDGHEAKRSYYLGFRQAQSEARPNIVIRSCLNFIQK